MNQKAALRRRIRAAIALLSPEEKAARSLAIQKHILAASFWQEAASVCLFAALPGEPDLDPLLSEGCALGKQISLPRIYGSRLELIAVTGHESLEPTRWGLREPRHDPAAIVAPESVDLLLIPGIAFTPRGARLGRGGGFYDRLLALLHGQRELKIGVCFEDQIVPEIPTESHDR